MRKFFGFIFVAAAAMLLLQACGAAEDAINNLTTRTEDVDVELDPITLTGTQAGRVAFAVVQTCPAGETSLNELLATAGSWDRDWEDYLQDIRIQELAYQITDNTTPVDVSLALQVTDPDTGLLAPVAATTIVAATDVEGWTPMPFAEGGVAIVEHYLNHRDAAFAFCAEAAPDDPDLHLTVQFRLNIEVEVGVNIL
ncbi:MAG: hypothetical protein P1P84_18150 [Deferrisomatales bacterium]|nr:hypothetical protein [Deferrisomatales bacterium]